MIRDATPFILITIVLLLGNGSTDAVLAQTEHEAIALQQWGNWRGPLNSGVAPHGQPPLDWNEDHNIRWKVAVGGRGHSSPVVWKDHLFITSAVPYGEKMEPRYSGAPGAHDNLPISQKHRYLVEAFDRRNGARRWQKTLHEALPHEGAHRSASLASASAATDGQRVIVSFGTYGIYALDFEGNLLWGKQFGVMNTKHGHGEAISPVLHKNRVIINWDHEGDSFVACLDASNGKTLWKKTRSEVTSWSTPIVVQHQDVDQVIVSGTLRTRAYDLSDGRVIWECGGLSNNIVASPVAGDGMVFVGSSYEKRAIMGIRLDQAIGDITGTDRVAWLNTAQTPYVPSPLLYQGGLYYLRHYQGVMTRVDAATGDDLPGAFRLRGVTDIYASPVAAKDRIYVTDLRGNTCVISAGEVPRILAINALDDSFAASAAIVGDELFLRGEKYLYCIGQPKEDTQTEADDGHKPN